MIATELARVDYCHNKLRMLTLLSAHDRLPDSPVIDTFFAEWSRPMTRADLPELEAALERVFAVVDIPLFLI